MSETGESDEGYQNLNCRRARKRKIIMKIEFNDSDDASTDSDVSDAGSGFIRPSNLPQKRNILKRAIISSDDSSSCDGEISKESREENKEVTVKDDEKEVNPVKRLEDGFASDSSNDETHEKCPICLLTFRNQEIASPATCDHIFCFICLEEWAKNGTTCPIDRREFKTIIVRDSYHSRKLVREVKTEVGNVDIEQENEELTYCEICHQHDREDVMLLCDGCNQGYHMDCLSPPLREIPEGSWYCDHCFESEGEDVDNLNLVYEDLREMGVPESRLRITEVRQPRVPRTRQYERVRARVFARNSEAEQIIENSRPQVASTSTGGRSRRRAKRRRRARRRRTYVVEYDVNNFDEKFAVKTTKRYIKVKRKRGKNSRKGRRLKPASCEISMKNIPRDERPLAAQSFSLFGNPNDLEYFSDSEDIIESNSGTGSTSIQTSIRLRNPTLRRRKDLLTRIEAPSARNGEVDVLSSIMELQDRWHNIARRNQFSSIHIGADGSLSFEENSDGRNIQRENVSQGRGDVNEKIDQAPLYPRGNNPNFSGGERYDNSNNYRNHSNFRNSGSQYRHSTGSSGFNLNPFRRDENSGQFNRSVHQNFSNNIQISPSFFERIRSQQNPRSERRNTNRFESNENPEGRQDSDKAETAVRDSSSCGESHTVKSTADVTSPANTGGNSNPLIESMPENYSAPDQISCTSTLTSNVPPLAPPPWNKNLFRLAGEYDDDDDADCPNFSIYSAESLQVARSSKENDEMKNAEKGQEDDFEEKEEDLVQLGDDDEIPDAIESGKKDTNESSDIYEPENPTGELEEESENKNECGGNTQEVSNKDPKNESDIAVQFNDEVSAEKQTNNLKPHPSTSNNKGIFELYDDSDWDEWNIDKNKLKAANATVLSSDAIDNTEITEKDDNQEDIQENIQTESISEEEEERSYTPCLDEKTEHDESMQNKDESHTPPKPSEKGKADSDRGDRSTTVIDGMETELISDEDEEILNQEQSAGNLKRKDKEKDESNAKKPRKETFKKISKNTKERNYRGDKERVKEKGNRSRSRSNDKENQNSSKRNERKRVKRKEIERYDVRNIIGQPRTYKDRYGRDTSRPPRSRSRTRSRSRRRRTRSRSKFRSRSVSSRRNRRSFSISPSPVSYMKSSSCRRSLSSRRSRSRRSRSRRRTPVRRRSRTPLRIRSPSPRANGRRKQKYRQRSHSISSRSVSRSRSRDVSPRRGRSKSVTRMKTKRKRSKDRKKKKNKKGSTSLTPSPTKRISRQIQHRDTVRKKKRRSRTKSPLERAWSPNSPRTATAENNDSSWTPPLVPSNTGNLTVILKNKDTVAESKKKGEKKKKRDKRRDPSGKKERRKQRSEVRESPIAPSKEVFASGDNILVSVSFNKEGNLALPPPQQTTVVTLPPTREEIVSKRRSAERGSRKQKRSKEKGQRRHKKVDAKPVAIIDLDRSPFQEIAQSPKDVIVLTDSDQEVDEHGDFSSRNVEMESLEQTNSTHQHDNIEKCANAERNENLQEESFESSLQQLGPKTPPEPPVIKFSLPAKSKQLKARNPLHEEQDETHNEQVEEGIEELEKSNANKIGPNTPPESGPCSPDAYDPFDPTKSPSVSPSPPPAAEISTPVENESSPVEDGRETRPQIISTQEKSMNPVDLVMALMNSKSGKSHDMCNVNTEQQYAMPANIEVNEIHDKADEGGMSKAITVLSNVLITPGKVQQRSSNLPTISSPVSKSSQSIGLTSQSIVSKLPLPRTSSSNRQSGGNDENVNEIESPYSPGSDDYDDLFEPPPENSTSLQQLSQRTRLQGKSNKSSKAELFDNLFGNTSPIKIPSYTPTAVRKRGMKSYKKTSVKVAKLSGSGKMDEDQIKIFDDLPSSAVELQVKDKFLRKLNRQERVVEEVKLVLKPHYNKKHISKEDYKEILRRAVPKICHSRSQEINPKKIQNLIEAYVKKFRQRNKLGLLNTGQVSSAVKCAAYLKKL